MKILTAIAGIALGGLVLMTHPAGGTEPPGGAIPKRAVTIDDLAAAVEAYVNDAYAASGGVFRFEDALEGRWLDLKLQDPTREGPRRLGDDGYALCAAFRTLAGDDRYDLDFFLHGKDPLSLHVTLVTIYRKNGLERYLWRQVDGIWKRE